MQEHTYTIVICYCVAHKEVTTSLVFAVRIREANNLESIHEAADCSIATDTGQ